MNTTSFARFAAVTAATGFASLALCAPASATHVTEPNAGGAGPTESHSPDTVGVTSGTNWTLVATGVGGGVVLVSAGAVVAGRRRHAGHLPHHA